jgi:ribosome biogenesis GTPase
MTGERLVQIGWGPFFQAQLERPPEGLDVGLDVGEVAPQRVVIEYQDRYRLLGADGHGWAQMTGNLLHAAKSDRLLRPAVGDWVLVRPGDGEDAIGTIVHLFDRRTRFIRQAAGRKVGPQVVAANIDAVFVVTSFNQDFNIRRIERYLTTVESSGARPLVVINKRDLCIDPAPYLAELADIAPDVPVLSTCALAPAPGGDEDDPDDGDTVTDDSGVAAMRAHIHPGETVALVGSSGVGKSALINRLLGSEQQPVGDIRERDGRGRHTTTHRELIVMPEGGVLIDTPGMRELKLWRPGASLLEAFPEIAALAGRCHFRDCNHGSEPGCAVTAAVADGTLARDRLGSYSKLAHEEQAAEARVTPGGPVVAAPPSRRRKPKKRR